MRPSVLVPIAACVLVLGGCFGRGGGQGATPPAAIVAQPPAAAWSAELQPTSSPVSGTVSLRPTADQRQTRAKLTLQNSVGGLVHRWEIRPGACGDESRPALGDAAAYGTAEVRADGTAELETSLPWLVPPGGAHHVNVLRSRSDATVIACGVLMSV